MEGETGGLSLGESNTTLFVEIVYSLGQNKKLDASEKREQSSVFFKKEENTSLHQRGFKPYPKRVIMPHRDTIMSQAFVNPDKQPRSVYLSSAERTLTLWLRIKTEDLYPFSGMMVAPSNGKESRGYHQNSGEICLA